MTSPPPSKRFKSDPPETPHPVIDDAMRVEQGLRRVFSQLDMPVPDGAMAADAAATGDETANNDSIDIGLAHYWRDLGNAAQSYRLNEPTCLDAIGALTSKVLPAIFNTNQDSLHHKYQEIIIKNPWLIHKLFDAYTSKTYHKIRRLDVFRDLRTQEAPEQEEFIETTGEGKEATVKSWDSKFVGNIPTALHGILRGYMKRTGLYARVASHVQSSGTGKSRAHDELAKQILYIPLNLAGSHATTYPPHDPKVYAWFSALHKWEKEQQGVRNHCNAFLHALLFTTRQRLQDIADDEAVTRKIKNPRDRLPILASEFRDRMAKGRTFDAHGAYRNDFYEDVFTFAKQNEMAIRSLPAPPDLSSQKSLSPNHKFSVDAAPLTSLTVKDVADEIVNLLDPQRKHDDPHVVICWDESHSLTQYPVGQRWSIYSELRRALRAILESSFISIFLSTAGKFHNFSPSPEYEPSTRLMTHVLEMLPPITVVGFDEFAERVDFIKDEWSLHRIASTHHMVHLGRALFPTRFDNGDDKIKKSIVTFAADKLLCRPSKQPGSRTGSGFRSQDATSSSVPIKLKPDESLACLAIRLGLDFNATSWVNREMERTQVERHMRMCIHATEGFRTMVTLSPSEPLLAEASATIMKTDLGEKEAPSALLDHIMGSYLSTGERGELVAALILLLARDKAAQEIPQCGGGPESESFKNDGMTTRRVITVPQFLEALVPSEHHDTVKEKKPHPCSPYYPSSTNLATAFGEAHIYFNHFIKVHDFKVINRVFLWRAICRGAAIICANNQSGVDILIPALMGMTVDPKFVTAILIQVKNDLSFTHVPRIALFTMMDPLEAGLFSKDNALASDLPPVLRIVFAMASKEPTVTAPSVLECQSPRNSKSKHSKPTFTAFDLWIAGVSPKSFGVIPDGDTHAQYKLLLDRTRNRFNGYGALAGEEITQKEQELMDLKRTMHAAAASGDPHYEKYIVNLSTNAASGREYRTEEYLNKVANSSVGNSKAGNSRSDRNL